MYFVYYMEIIILTYSFNEYNKSISISQTILHNKGA